MPPRGPAPVCLYNPLACLCTPQVPVPAAGSPGYVSFSFAPLSFNTAAVGGLGARYALVISTQASRESGGAGLLAG